jgi:2-keto-4-pentenoate hydratase/2-oxohepta-3-ene-1,7-dioic acid hydratase in catechol pathway
VLAIGLNYAEHAAESGFDVPEEPTVLFTKWQSCLTGPVTEVVLPDGGHTDWEVELVVVLGRRAFRISADEAWAHVAGLTVGQDISERILQTAGPSPQFSMGKSLPGFGPTGPWLVTPDEFDNPDDLELGCSVNGNQMQKGRTRDLIFSVPAMLAALSRRLPLLPGDVLFTGTPSGVGLGRSPQVWLAPGDELVSYVAGIGELRQRFVAAP